MMSAPLFLHCTSAVPLDPDITAAAWIPGGAISPSQYSSLQYLKRLPLDQIKIDQSFVRDIVTDTNDAAIVQTIIAMGEVLGLNVIAERVETEAQREFLDLRGCRAFQGYLFGRPIPLPDFEKQLRDINVDL